MEMVVRPAAEVSGYSLMEKSAAPTDYEGLIQVIHERYDSMSKGYQTIALYLTQNPNDVAVRSVNAIAEGCGVHASNFVRFAQALGYTGFKDLQGLFQKRLSTAAPGFDARVKALEDELGSTARPQRVRLLARSCGARRRLAADNARRHRPGRSGQGCRLAGKGRHRLSARAAPFGSGRRVAALRAHHARQALRPARSERRARDPHGTDDAGDAMSWWRYRSGSTRPRS